MAKEDLVSTPVMKQYREIKSRYPDAILLFRMGDFYETFEEDAKITSRILNITLTKRANGKASKVPLAGFPYHALDSYLHKLLEAGLKVAICEQVEDPKKAKGIVKREVVEVITPGTAITDRFLDTKENNYLVSIYKTQKGVGIAAIDVSTGEFYLTDSDDKSYKDTVSTLKASEIICPESDYKSIEYEFKGKVLRVAEIDDWVYSYEYAERTLKENFKTETLKGFGIEKYKLGISAAGAIIHYLHQNNQKSLEHVVKIQPLLESDYVLIDEFTKRNLEIFRTMQSGEVKGSLIWVVDQTVTASGSRLLKKWLAHPLKNPQRINSRLDKVEYFYNNTDKRENVRNLLKDFSDLERLLSRISANRATAREVYQLRETLKLIPVILKEFEKVDTFKELLSGINIPKELIKILDDAIKDEDLPTGIHEGGFIKEGFNEQLDKYRRVLRDGKNWILELQEKERARLGIPSLKISYNKVFGYYIEVTKTHISKVPENYIRKQTLVNAERFITPELKEYEEMLLNAEEKISEIEYEIFQFLREEILKYVEDILKIADVVSQIDVFSSLAYIAIKNNYTRPVINDSSRIFIKNGRHPVVEALLPSGEKFIPNDLDIDNQTKQILIITGPNMAGKSTYLRQVGLIVLLAQIGSFIPAESAEIGVVDKIFTRVGASDNLAAGESTFLMEMIETANILNNATPKSLILLDEIGRGTSTYDGIAIAWAVTEYLHNNEKIGSKTLFATHYHELTELEKILPRVINLNVAVKEYGDKVIFLRKIIPGACDKSYGVHVAQMAGVPVEVTLRANEILSNISREERVLPTEKDIFQKLDKNPDQLSLFNQIESKIKKELSEIDINSITPLEALNKLNELKKKYGL
ncbi:MAG: DNA mismatch repair protein MutS [Candidatus Marinimicrobia bacterium]|nr:DNA mismatch repair protein MutS [Candidatus Neomarinimicrobiota bacterium]